jgi:homospermidine synthase
VDFDEGNFVFKKLKKKEMEEQFTTLEFTINQEELMVQLSRSIDPRDIAEFIAKLAHAYEDLDVTIDLIRHFKFEEERINQDFSKKQLKELGYENMSSKPLIVPD